MSDVDYKSLTHNRVTAPYAGHYVTLDLNLHFPVGTRPPAPAAPPPPAPRSELPQAHQVASLVPVAVDTAAAPVAVTRAATTAPRPEPAAAPHRFTLRYDEENAVLTPRSVRALHDALDAIEAGQDVQIAIGGCETDADYADGSPCARHALRLRHLLPRYGVENPGQFLIAGR